MGVNIISQIISSRIMGFDGVKMWFGKTCFIFALFSKNELEKCQT